jgi:hypothetical protein
MRASVEFQQWAVLGCIDRRFVTVQRALKVGPIVPCPTLDQSVVVAGYSVNGRSVYVEISTCGMARVWGPDKGPPWDHVFNEHRPQRIQPCKMFRESLEVGSQRDIAVQI